MTEEQIKQLRLKAETWHGPPRHTEPERCLGCAVIMLLDELEELKQMDSATAWVREMNG